MVPDYIKLPIRQLASPAIRNMGTLAGNLCNASSSGDSLPMLYALDAEVTLASVHGTRKLPVGQFITFAKQTLLQPDELVTEITIPFVDYTVSHYRKIGGRQVNAISKASFYAVAIKKDGIVEDVRIAFGSVAPTAVRDRACEEILIGAAETELDAKIETLRTRYGELLAPLDDTRSTADYRRHVSLEVVGGFHREGAGDMNKKAIQIIYWGSLWGIAEATLGYVLHMAAIQLPGVPGFVMFPVAFYFMRKSYLAIGKADSVFQVALVAALIKCCDFLISGNIPIRILNPALSILLEGLTVAAVFVYAERRKTAVGFVSVFSMGFLWRAVFLFYLFLISLIDLPAALVTDGLQFSLRFLFLESLVNAILMLAYLKIERTERVVAVPPLVAYAALATAIMLTLAF